MPLERVPDGAHVGWFGERKDNRVGNRTGHAVFIPWDATEGAEWTQKTANWNHARANKFDVVCYQGGAVDPVLTAISNQPGGVVYIRGHGNPGVPYIMANYQATNYQSAVGLVLSITDACQRLIDTGLGTAFSGAIKFYSCHSGTKPTKQTRISANQTLGTSKQYSQAWVQQTTDELATGPNAARRDALLEKQHAHSEVLKKGDALDKSLARQGADYLRSQGFKHCVFYGYLGPLGSTYELDLNGDAVGSKTVELEGLQNRPKHLKGLSNCRPSVARVQV